MTSAVLHCHLLLSPAANALRNGLRLIIFLFHGCSKCMRDIFILTYYFFFLKNRCIASFRTGFSLLWYIEKILVLWRFSFLYWSARWCLLFQSFFFLSFFLSLWSGRDKGYICIWIIVTGSLQWFISNPGISTDFGPGAFLGVNYAIVQGIYSRIGIIHYHYIIGVMHINGLLPHQLLSY